MIRNTITSHNTLTKVYILLAMLSFYACSSPKPKKIVNHQVVFVKGSSNNKLEVLDWGGTGPALLFLAGLGNTSHIFDDFAPRFTNKFHVYGLTRRGFGASYLPAADYSQKTLAKDILAVLNRLHINKVILIGHSIAGEEISRFASSYPGRVSKVIYLDAAYDRTTLDFKRMQTIVIQNPTPTAKDSSSFKHWKDFNKRIYGFSFPNEELKQISMFSKEGKYMQEITPATVFTAILDNVERPDYTHINCKALALYAKFESAAEVIPSYAELDVVNKKSANEYFIQLQKYSNKEQASFKKQMRQGTIKFINGANHYIFISNPVETEKMISDFLQ
jgi:non-heme chloroperoxidase